VHGSAVFLVLDVKPATYHALLSKPLGQIVTSIFWVLRYFVDMVPAQVSHIHREINQRVSINHMMWRSTKRSMERTKSRSQLLSY